MDDTAVLAALGVDPATLAPAPARVRTADARTRWGQPCTVCRADSVATRVVTLPDGPHWMDTCRDHMVAAAYLRSRPAA